MPLYEPIIPLPILGPQGQTQAIEAVVDTGYNGFLILPVDLVAELRLDFAYTDQVVLANGDQVRLDYHEVTVLWDGQPRNIMAAATGNAPLVGMRLLDNHNLNINIHPGGRVLIQPQPLMPNPPILDPLQPPCYIRPRRNRAGRVAAALACKGGGKSGLRRAGCWVTPRLPLATNQGRRKVPQKHTAFAPRRGKARLKWRGKSSPRPQRWGWQANPTRSKAE